MIVVPEPGMAGEIGRQLLALADDPRQVQWVTWPVPAGFKVPQELAARFHAAYDSDPGGATEDVPRKRRPGRPRKQVDTPAPVPGTDDETPKEE